MNLLILVAIYLMLGMVLFLHDFHEWYDSVDHLTRIHADVPRWVTWGALFTLCLLVGPLMVVFEGVTRWFRK